MGFFQSHYLAFFILNLQVVDVPEQSEPDPHASCISMAIYEDQKTEITDLKKQVKILQLEVQKFKQRSEDQKHISACQRKGDLTLNVKHKIVREVLQSKYSEAQLDVMLGIVTYSKKWTSEDYAKSLEIGYSSKKALEKIRKIFPLPSFSKAAKIFNFISAQPGYLQPFMKYLIYIQQLPSWEENHRLALICYDEMAITSSVQLDTSTETPIGPAKQAFVLMVRGIVGSWMCPFNFNFDFEMTTEFYLEIISKLYEIGIIVKLSVSDQGRTFKLVSCN